MNLSILIEYVIAAICIDENNGLRLALGRSAILTRSIIHRGKCSLWNLLVFSCIWVTGTQIVELPVMSTSGLGPLSSRMTKNQQWFSWQKNYQFCWALLPRQTRASNFCLAISSQFQETECSKIVQYRAAKVRYVRISANWIKSPSTDQGRRRSVLGCHFRFDISEYG